MKIRLEIKKLQYDINREAAKISALSSGNIDKYEYLTGEEILPSNQQQIIEQAKFIYFPLGKTFEKHSKTIEDQGEKQIKATQNKDFNKSMEKPKFDSDDDLAILRQKEIYNELTEEKKNEIENCEKSIDRNKLIYKYKGITSYVNFGEYFGAIDLINKIENGDVSLRKAVNDQYELKSKLGEIKKGNPNRKSKTNLNIIKNFDKLDDSVLLNTLKEFWKLEVEQNKKKQD